MAFFEKNKGKRKKRLQLSVKIFHQLHNQVSERKRAKSKKKVETTTSTWKFHNFTREKSVRDSKMFHHVMCGKMEHYKQSEINVWTSETKQERGKNTQN